MTLKLSDQDIAGIDAYLSQYPSAGFSFNAQQTLENKLHCWASCVRDLRRRKTMTLDDHIQDLAARCSLEEIMTHLTPETREKLQNLLVPLDEEFFRLTLPRPHIYPEAGKWARVPLDPSEEFLEDKMYWEEPEPPVLSVDFFMMPEELWRFIARFATTHSAWVVSENGVDNARIHQNPEPELAEAFQGATGCLVVCIGQEAISPPMFAEFQIPLEGDFPIRNRKFLDGVKSQCVKLVVIKQSRDNTALPLSSAFISERKWFADRGVDPAPAEKYAQFFEKELLQVFDKHIVAEVVDPVADVAIARHHLTAKTAVWVRQGNSLTVRGHYPHECLVRLAERPKKPSKRKD